MRGFWHIIFVLLVSAGQIQSQEIAYEFKHLNTSDGLSQTSVIAIHQDHLGRMWFGTRDGLNVYDGNSIKVYRSVASDSTSISNSDILSMVEDRDGYLWVGTHNGLNRYDPVKDEFKRYYYSKDSNSISNNIIWSLKELDNGDIWIGTYNGLSIFNKESGHFSNYYHDDQDNSSISSDYILSIEQSSNGSIWLGTSRGLTQAFFDEESNLIFKRISPDEAQDPPFIQVVSACDQNTLYVGTKGKGLLKFDMLSNRFLDVDNVGKDQDIRAISVGDPGAIWLGTSEGITILNNDGDAVRLSNHTYDSRSVSNNYIKSIYRDVNGSIWIGSYYGGIDFWDPANTNFITYSDQSANRKLGYKAVSSIVSDAFKNIYIGTEGGGVTIFPHNSLEAEYINLDKYPKLKSDNIKSIHADGNSLWLGTFDKGLIHFQLEEKRIQNDLISSSLNELLGSSGVYAIKSSDKNNLWIGSFGRGLVNYNIKTKAIKRFYKEIPEGQGLSSNYIRCLIIDQANNIWIGTQDGLNFLPFSEGSNIQQNIIKYFYDGNSNTGDDVLSIYQDKSGTIWVGLRARGLFKFDGRDFIHYPLEATRSITSIYTIEEDKDNILWLGTNQGIVKLNKSDRTFKSYSQKDGLVGNEYASGASLKMNEADFYFGGAEGVSFFNSMNLSESKFAPKTILTDLRVNNELESPKRSDGILSQSLPFTSSISLAHDQSNFSIDYAMPNFISPKSNKYRYRVVGLNDNWTLTEQSRATFTIQRAGDYVFEVQGANNDGVWNQEVTSLYIEVRPPIWKSTWAYFVYALLVGLGLYWVYYSINAKTVLEHKLQLEHLSNERNKEINDAKLRFFTNISHEFRTPLTLITGPLQQILNEYKGSSLVYKQLLVIESNAKHLLLLINRLMDFRKLENKSLRLSASEGNLVKFIEEVYLSFSEYAKVNGYRYSFSKSTDYIPVYYDRAKMEQVFYNLISNAFKYTPSGGEIEVRIRMEARIAVVEIVDTGLGIDPNYRDKVFDRFFEIPHYKGKGRGQNSGTGIGLSIAKHIVDLHKGNISIHDNMEQGSVFKVQIQLGRSHLGEDQIVEDFKFSDDIELYESQEPYVKMDEPIKLNQALLEAEKATILVVEDNVPLRFFIKELLEQDYNILEAGEGQEALNKAIKHLPDLVISDVMMPGMVGTELCSKIKSNMSTSHIPVILLTSRTSLLYKFEGLESGADDYISKPFDITEFRLRVRNLLESTKRLRNKFSDSRAFDPRKVASNSVDEELLKRAIALVEENIGNSQFDIASFCSQLGVSRTLLFTKIKAWTDHTPNEFIQEMRMKRAIQLLEQDKLNVSEISYEVGFRNPKYFSKCFNKKYGISPSGYRDKFSENFHQ